MEKFPVFSEMVEVNGYHATVFSNGMIGSMTANKDGSRMPTPKEMREQAEFLLVLAKKIDEIKANEVYAFWDGATSEPKVGA